MTDEQANAFTGGMAVAFVLHWVVLIAVTYSYCLDRGC